MTASNCGLRKQADSNNVQQQLNSCQALTKEKKEKHWSGILWVNGTPTLNPAF